MGGGLINAAYVPMSKELGVSVQQASIVATPFILFTGVTPMALAPFASVYGRRNLYLVVEDLVMAQELMMVQVFILIASVSNIGSGAAATYGGVIVGRIFCGIGASLPLGLGAATVSIERVVFQCLF